MLRDTFRKGVKRVGGGVKRRLKRAIGRSEVRSEGMASAPAEPPQATPVSPFAAKPEPTPTTTMADSDDTAGAPLTVEQVLDLFEDMVRPALQSDGGDIDLVKVEDNDVYVRLTGACSSCPSSTVTMKMGIERLLVEEFPQFRHLIQVA